MNPSATGWINKFGHLVQKNPVNLSGHEELYFKLKEIGFVYGIHIDVFPNLNTELKLTEDEIAKINLLVSLYFTYKLEYPSSDFGAFVDTVFAYYKSLEVGKFHLSIRFWVQNVQNPNWKSWLIPVFI